MATRSVDDGLLQMRRCDRVGAGEIGDRPRDLEDTMERSPGEEECFRRSLQRHLGLVIETTVARDLLRRHERVELRRAAAKPGTLDAPRPLHPAPDVGGALTRDLGEHFMRRERADRDAQVDPIE